MRRTVLATALTAALCTGWPAIPHAAAASMAAPGSIGHDVSSWQCDAKLPAGAFGIVGITAGRAFDPANRCLAQQYSWAKGLPHAPGVYVNTGNPGPAVKRWATVAVDGPAQCRDATSYTDPGCAYNYGWRSMEHAMTVARKAGVSKGHTWWLDVETTNSWDGNAVANAADLQGAYDYLRTNGVTEVGIYSTEYQWRTITGGYHASSAARYRAAWATAFEPKHAMEKAPLWQAGVEKLIRDGAELSGLAVAKERCGISFTGARVRFGQFVVDDLDHNLVCSTPKISEACRTNAPIPAGYKPIFGHDSADRLRGTSKDEILYGGPGADILEGRDGDDILCGGSGKDDLRGGDDADLLYGGSSDDLLTGGSGRDKLYGEAGSDTLDGGSGSDSCFGGADKDKSYKSC